MSHKNLYFHALTSLFLALTLATVGSGDAFRFPDCASHWDAVAAASSDSGEIGLGTLSSEQRTFFRNQFMPLVGKRLLSSSPSDHRSLTVQGGNVTIGGFGEGQNLRFRFLDTPNGEPQIQYDRHGQRVLVVPKGYDLSKLPRRGADLAYHFLKGHTLQPHTDRKNTRVAQKERQALDEPPIVLREVQIQGREAARQSALAGDKSFLYVAPTGTGKTEILKSVIETQLERGRRREIPGLHILTAHTEALVNQLYDDAQSIPNGRVEYIRWGGSEGERGGTMLELLERVADAKQRGNQVILVTTTKSLVNSLRKNRAALSEAEMEAAVETDAKKIELDGDLVGLLKEDLGTISIDEAHHAGAPNTHEVLKQLLDNSQAFLFGATATPTHREVQVARDLFGSNDFWAYLDTPDGFRLRSNDEQRDISHVIKQLEEAIKRGELNNFDPVYLNPEAFRGLHNSELFTNETGEGRWVINPDHYPAVTEILRPFLKRHQQGFFAVRTTTEAERLVGHLKGVFNDVPLEDMAKTDENGQVREQMFAFLHSDMHPDQKRAILRGLREGRIRFLFTVNMLDEGIDVPGLTLYGDLTRSTDPKQLLQRLGRVLRLAPDKDRTRPDGRPEVQMLTFQDVNDVQTADMLLKLDAMNRDKIAGEPRDTEEETDPGAGEGGKQKTPKKTKDPEEIRPIQWSEADLARLKKFFTTDSGRTEKALKEADQVTRAAETLAGSQANFSITTMHRGKVKTAVELIATRDDMGDAHNGKHAFFARLANNGAQVDTLVREYQQERQRLLGGGASAQEVATAFRQMHSALSASGLTRSDFTRDQNRLHALVMTQVSEGNPQLINALLSHGPSSALKASGAEDALESLARSRPALGRLAAKFYTENSRLPDRENSAYEKFLAEALERTFPVAEDLFKVNEALSIDLLAAREARQALNRPPPTEPKPAEKPPERPSAVARTPVGNTDFSPAPILTGEVPAKLQTLIRNRLERLGGNWSRERDDLAALDEMLVNFALFREFHADAKKAGELADAAESARELRELQDKILTIQNLRLLQGIPPPSSKQNEVTVTFAGGKSPTRALVEIYSNYAKARGWDLSTAKTVDQAFRSETTLTFYGPGVAEFFAREAGATHVLTGKEQEGVNKGKDFTGETTLSLGSERRATPREVARRKWTQHGTFNDTRLLRTQAYTAAEIGEFHEGLELRQFENWLQRSAP